MPRRPGPEPPRGEFLLEPPPELPEAGGGGGIGQYLMYLPMIGGAGAMFFLYAGSGGTPITYMASAMYGLSSLGMVASQFGRNAGDRGRKADGDRRDYMRYLSQARRRVRDAIEQQARSQFWNHPDPDCLWSFAMSSRRWERRPEDPDFAEVRLATGGQRLALRLVPPETKPVEDLEPITAGALRGFVAAYRMVDGLPIAVALRNYPLVEFSGDDRVARAVTRALLAQAATFHAPEDLRIALCADPGRMPVWEWLKWLPHALHPKLTDGVGPVRLVGHDLGELEELLGADLAERPRYRRGEQADGHAQLVVVLDGGRVPPGCQLAMGDAHGVTVLDLQGVLGRPADDQPVLRLRVSRDEIMTVSVQPGGEEQETPIGRPDRLDINQAEALAHLLLPHRSAAAEPTAAAAAGRDLAALLNLGDLVELDPAVCWQRRAPRDQLRVPIGLTETGSPVNLDIKEAAQGGSGPHGLLVGATGSGKSELLRTLVLGLAATHSPEALNFVLADFKGGATFLGLEGMPHISAIITNLAEELPLVDRMQDALRGEIVRRQELLRSAGNFASVLDYERARGQGAPLEPLPTLVIVVDEFSEMLTSKPEFAELFVMIGRVGRSLAVHLLLASQRLEEGRLRGLETHLSYRLCLRTFSANESRIVLGVPDASTLPSEPGNGYLRTDISSMTRFRAAYVSGPYERPAAPEQHEAAVRRFLAPYQAAPVALPAGAWERHETPVLPRHAAAANGGSGLDSTPLPDGSGRPAPRVLDVVVDRLRGKGRPAHRVWLPPLREPPTLDQLLSPLSLDSGRGLSAKAPGELSVPFGILDLPFEQRRAPLIADLSGAAGNVAVIGAQQSGKSTMLRALIGSLALTCTPREAQFYCLDFGGGALGTLSALPHVGGIASRREPDLVRRMVAELTTLLEDRERDFAAAGIDAMASYRAAPDGRYADVFLVVDGWGVLRAEFEELETAITTLATRGLSYGIHVVLATNRWAELRPQLRDVLGSRFELRLGDPFESEVNRYAAANVPAGTPGRGIVTGNLHFLSALPRIDGKQHADDLADGARELAETVRAAWAGPPAPPVRMLPARVGYAELVASVPEGAAGFPLGLAEEDLGPVLVDFAAEQHFMVFGETEAGKTTVLRTLLAGLIARLTPQDARVLVLDYRRGLLDAVDSRFLVGFANSAPTAAQMVRDTTEAMVQRLPGPDVTSEQLRTRSWWRGPELYLVVDDYDLLVTPSGNPLAPLLDVLAQSRDVGLHVILARATGGAGRAMYEPVMQRLRELGAGGIVLSGSPDEGPLLGTVTARRQPPGCGILYSRRRGTRRVQVAI
jgi:DNA segregation ATPase FtsK/SpoIIIE, S-DNA-T family